MRDDGFEDILLVEDTHNLLEHSINTLIEMGCGNICITRDCKDVLDSGSNGMGHGISMDISGNMYALIYLKPSICRKKTVKSLKINSKLRIIPLLLLSGPAKDIKNIMNHMGGAYQCITEHVKLRDFIEKVEDLPMFWASIDAIDDRDSIRIKGKPQSAGC